MLLHVRSFPELPGGQPGPALFPGIVGGLLVMFGLVLAARAALTRGPRQPVPPPAMARPRAAAPAAAAPHTAGPDSGPDNAGPDASGGIAPPAVPPARRAFRLPPAVRATAVLAAVAGYLLVADLAGFIPTMVVLLWLLMMVLGARVLPALGAAVAATVVVFYLFRTVLLVPLPQGPWG